MTNDSHNLKFSVLKPSQDTIYIGSSYCLTNLESFVLQYSLDCSIFSAWRQFRLEYYSERAVANNLALSILQVARLSCETILHLLANYLCNRMLVHVLNGAQAFDHGWPAVGNYIPPTRRFENAPPGRFCDIVSTVKMLRSLLLYDDFHYSIHSDSNKGCRQIVMCCGKERKGVCRDLSFEKSEGRLRENQGMVARKLDVGTMR